MQQDIDSCSKKIQSLRDAIKKLGFIPQGVYVSNDLFICLSKQVGRDATIKSERVEHLGQSWIELKIDGVPVTVMDLNDEDYELPKQP